MNNKTSKNVRLKNIPITLVAKIINKRCNKFASKYIFQLEHASPLFTSIEPHN